MEMDVDTTLDTNTSAHLTSSMILQSSRYLLNIEERISDLTNLLLNPPRSIENYLRTQKL